MKILKNEAADQQDRHGDVQNGNPEPECGQPEQHVAVHLCFLTMEAVLDQSRHERTHFRPTKTRTHKTPGSSHTLVVDVVLG